MKIDQNSAGWETTLKPHRFNFTGGGAFPALWALFVGLASGLFLAVGVTGVWAIEFSQGPSMETTARSACIFSLCGLILWILGGLAAGRLSGRDRLRLQRDGLAVEHRFGFLRKNRFFPREKLLRFYCTPRRSNALVLKSSEGTQEITSLGTKEERKDLETRLNREFQLTPPPDAETGAIPSGWCELTPPGSIPVFAREPAAQRRLQQLQHLFVFPFVVACPFLFGEFGIQPKLSTVLIVALVAAILTAWSLVTTGRSREEWELGNGGLTLQRRRAASVVPQFKAASLSLHLIFDDTDTEGCFVLVANTAAEPERVTFSYRSKQQRAVYGGSGNTDYLEVRDLGLWLANRSRVPFFDRTTSEAKT